MYSNLLVWLAPATASTLRIGLFFHALHTLWCMCVNKINQCWCVHCVVRGAMYTAPCSLQQQQQQQQRWQMVEAAGKQSSISAMNHELCILVGSFLWINSSVNIGLESLRVAHRCRLFGVYVSCLYQRCTFVSSACALVFAHFKRIHQMYPLSVALDLSQWQHLLIIKFNSKQKYKDYGAHNHCILMFREILEAPCVSARASVLVDGTV